MFDKILITGAFRFLACLAILVFGGIAACAQNIVIKGKVIDAVTEEPVFYATIAVKGTSIGTNSNFDGRFKLELTKRTDSITVSCIGYIRQSFHITRAAEQTLNIRLKPFSQQLREVRVTPKSYVNPAWEIMSEVIKHKPTNDYRALQSYQYESYSRIELDATNFSANLLRKRGFDKAISIADSLHITTVDRLPVLPLFVSETASEFYYRQNPDSKKEDIKRTKTNGVGFEDGTLLAQLTGSTFQQYNFYRNFVSAAGKDFISPIADGWKAWYNYELENRNVVIDGKLCYQISFRPKRSQDLAFTGTIWIAQENYALYQIKATIEPSANLNFIHRISIQQQMEGDGTERPWLPVKTRILVEVNQLTANTSGLLAKSYTAAKNIIVNKDYPAGFFNEGITMADDVLKRDEHFWDMNRPDSLTKAEKSVYSLIDTVKDIPAIRTYITVADLLINGSYRVGGVSFGPFLQTYSYNSVEGSRFRIGFKTNSDFNNKWILGSYIAVRTKNRDVKFGASVDYIFDRKNWTEAGIGFTHDINQVALLSDNYLYQRNNLFSAFTRFGRIDKRKVFDQNFFNAYIQRDIFKTFTEKISFANWSLNPQFLFNFNEPNGQGMGHLLHVSEIHFESKWSPGIQPLLSETFNRPVNLKTDVTQPVLTFRYTLGLNLFGGDFTYHKFTFNITEILKMGVLGRGRYSLSAGYIPSSVPYPLLENHLGNEIAFYNPYAFNLMHFFEFASDKYASLNYTQHFEGLLLNSIPVIKKFKWRLVGTANILYGSISPTNQHNIYDLNSIPLRGLGSTPYAEAGYGIENIFQFIRVDFIHRLTYRNDPGVFSGNVRNFGVKISAQIRL
ncbi:MAG: DUF5686 and carboxypeptidase-like regulatory domain-containing protein [Mucilaginibacter sp.]